MELKRIVFIILGCLCLGLGCAGIALPVLPTVPFFLATVFFFANSSRRLHDWFVGTKLYRRHLESYVQRQGMLLRTKLTILATVTLVMGVGFVLMFRKGVYIPCAILALVWVGHLIYFLFGVPTLPSDASRKER